MDCKPDRASIYRTVALAVTLVLFGALVACERDMTIAVTRDSNPPTFRLSGSGRLFFFTVYEASRDRPSSIDDAVLWKIQPTQKDLISKLPEITYGVVPPGFAQTEPKTGTPPPLVEGKLYEAGGPALEANGGGIRFTIKDGKVIVQEAGR
jgi:hypothetical protein